MRTLDGLMGEPGARWSSPVLEGLTRAPGGRCHLAGGLLRPSGYPHPCRAQAVTRTRRWLRDISSSRPALPSLLIISVVHLRSLRNGRVKIKLQRGWLRMLGHVSWQDKMDHRFVRSSKGSGAEQQASWRHQRRLFFWRSLVSPPGQAYLHVPRASSPSGEDRSPDAQDGYRNRRDPGRSSPSQPANGEEVGLGDGELRVTIPVLVSIHAACSN